MNKEITLYDIKKILGEPTGKLGGEYVWQCPYCMDSHKDNMRFNERKGLLWCFADPEHSKEILKKMNGNEIDYRPAAKSDNSVPKWVTMQDKYVEYMVQCQEELLGNQELLDYVYKKRGLSKKVIDLVGMGFDSEANQFVIPIFGLKEDMITDFELRLYSDKKVISRVGGGHNTVAVIYGTQKAKTLIFTEGFLDGYALLQFMLDKGQTDFTIYSCSHGADSLLKCLPSVNFSQFGEVKLMLDNDDAGDKATKAILEYYPFIKDSRDFLKKDGVKDFTEWFLCQALFV
jgi:hypothetical protein